MTDVDRRAERRMTLGLLAASPLIIFVWTFVPLYVTYLVTRSLASDQLGEVAARPAAYAASIALVALPMHLPLAFTWRSVRAVLNGAELPTPPVRTGWRRFTGYLVRVLPDGAAAAIVFLVLAPPGAASRVPLLTVTLLGPIALFWSGRGLGVLRRWGWRRWTNRGYQPRHQPPGDQLTAEKPPMVLADARARDVLRSPDA